MSEFIVKPAWELAEAIIEARLFENLAARTGWHVALGGGVLKNGYSAKDIDLILYPHKTDDATREKPFSLMQRLEGMGYVEDVKLRDHKEYNDGKIVYCASRVGSGKRVDFIFTYDL